MSTFRYENPGNAELLNTSGTTLEVDESKSVTSIAFYGSTTRTANFSTPAGIKEIWFKFDLYIDSAAAKGNRFSFGHYSSSLGGYVGIWNGTENFSSQFSPDKFLCDATPTTAINTNIKGTLGAISRVLLHMISHASNGLIELNVNGTTYTRTGNINNGADFDTLYFYSDTSNILFSNIIVSDSAIQEGEGWHRILFDIKRKLSNAVEVSADVERLLSQKWRYENYGTADTLTITGTTLTDLPDSQSRTGSAFYQTTRAKCFDLPATSEVWMKFDVYFNGSNRWRAYNGGANGTIGITAQTNGDLSFFANDTNVQQPTGICKSNTLQTVLLHMISGSSDGVIEAWVDGTKIYRYTGDVNHGSDFADLYLQSDGAGTFFSNVIISNAEIDFSENAKIDNVTLTLTADVVRRVETPEHIADLFSALKVWLPFDKSPIFDFFLNEWTPYGNPTIADNALLLDGSSRLQLENFELGGQDFTVDGWLNMDAASPSNANVFALMNTSTGFACAAVYRSGSSSKLLFWSNQYADLSQNSGFDSVASFDCVGKRVHFELVYRYSARTLTLFIDGKQAAQRTSCPQFVRMTYTVPVGAFDNGNSALIGSLDEFRIFDGLALHTANFDPPTAEEYDYFKARVPAHDFTFDAQRNISNRVEVIADLERRVKNVTDVQFSADVLIRDVLPVSFTADLVRRATRPVEFNSDVELLDVVPVEFTADISRNIKAKFKLYTTDTAPYFSGGTSTPIVIPTQDTIPPAYDSDANMQSIEISLSEQQLTDQVKLVGISPLDIMFPVQGQYLDYVCDMRVERVQRQGILYTVDCCSDIDALLYTQMAYKLPEFRIWENVTNLTVQTISTHYPTASEHVNKIANALGLTPVMQFDDFLSTVLMSDLGGLTYADIIRDVFGWSSRVPTHLINVYIRNGKLFVVQRGHESNIIDISDAEKTLPIYTHELVRTTWGSAPGSNTQTREQLNQNFIPNDSIVGGGASGSDSGGDDSGGGSGSGSGDSGDDKDDEKSWLNVGTVVVEDNEGVTRTTYHYDKEGVLMRTVAVFTSKSDPTQNTTTTTTNSYNSDDLLKRTEVHVAHYDSRDNTQTVTTYGYLTLSNKQKFLSTEMVEEYSFTHGYWELENSRITTKSPTGRGQGSSADNGGNIDTSGNIGDDRVTPYSENKANDLINSLPDNNQDSHEQIFAGLPLFDSSFPIHNRNKLIELTEALKWLNRKTRETVTLSIYNFPHLIDFNDRIILDGAEFFLVANRATSIPRIFNEQALTLTRWF